MNLPLVSVIIPCYNSERFVSETIRSVFSQSHQNFELIIVNDGSTDNSETEILFFKDPRIKYFLINNSGVSNARNYGLNQSIGKYLIFLDSDDILTPDFLQKRVEFLESNLEFGFCCSPVINIDENGIEMKGELLKGAATNIKEEVLGYNPVINTCPSNYLIRSEILHNHSLRYKSHLSSSADRYFLIQLSDFSKGQLLETGGYLKYRVRKDSMSNHLSLSLIRDNILFQETILKNYSLSNQIKKEFCFKINYIFAGSFLKIKNYKLATWYAFKAFSLNPREFIKKLIKT